MARLEPIVGPTLAALLLMAGAGCAGRGLTASSQTPDSTAATDTVTVGFVARSIVVGGTTYRYKVFVPHDYTASQNWPLILFLPGSGQRGTDNVSQIQVGLGPHVAADSATFSAIVVFPQFPLTPEGTSDPAQVLALQYTIASSAVSQTRQQYRVDSARIYLTGISAGGFRAWELAYANPSSYAAIVPISAGICAFCITGSRESNADSLYAVVAAKLKNLPAWVFHAADDPTAPVQGDSAVVAAFRAVGAPIRYTEYASGGHAIWDRAYAEPTLWTWLFQQHR